MCYEDVNTLLSELILTYQYWGWFLFLAICLELFFSGFCVGNMGLDSEMQWGSREDAPE